MLDGFFARAKVKLQKYSCYVSVMISSLLGAQWCKSEILITDNLLPEKWTLAGMEKPYSAIMPAVLESGSGFQPYITWQSVNEFWSTFLQGGHGHWFGPFYILLFSHFARQEQAGEAPPSPPEVPSGTIFRLFGETAASKKCEMAVVPGVNLAQIPEMVKEPCTFYLLPAVYKASRVIDLNPDQHIEPLLELFQFVEDKSPSNELSGETTVELPLLTPSEPDDLGVQEINTAEMITPAASSTEHSMVITPVLRLSLQGSKIIYRNQRGDIIRIDEVATPLLPVRQSVRFRIIPVLCLNAQGKRSHCYYKLWVDSWQNLVKEPRVYSSPIIQPEENFRDSVFIHFRKGSGIHKLLVDLRYMPEQMRCDQLFTSSSLQIHLRELLFVTGTPCDSYTFEESDAPGYWLSGDYGRPATRPGRGGDSQARAPAADKGRSKGSEGRNPNSRKVIPPVRGKGRGVVGGSSPGTPAGGSEGDSSGAVNAFAHKVSRWVLKFGDSEKEVKKRLYRLAVTVLYSVPNADFRKLRQALLKLRPDPTVSNASRFRIPIRLWSSDAVDVVVAERSNTVPGLIKAIIQNVVDSNQQDRFIKLLYREESFFELIHSLGILLQQKHLAEMVRAIIELSDQHAQLHRILVLALRNMGAIPDEEEVISLSAYANRLDLQVFQSPSSLVREFLLSFTHLFSATLPEIEQKAFFSRLTDIFRRAVAPWIDPMSAMFDDQDIYTAIVRLLKCLPDDFHPVFMAAVEDIGSYYFDGENLRSNIFGEVDALVEEFTAPGKRRKRLRRFFLGLPDRAIRNFDQTLESIQSEMRTIQNLEEQTQSNKANPLLSRVDPAIFPQTGARAISAGMLAQIAKNNSCSRFIRELLFLLKHFEQHHLGTAFGSLSESIRAETNISLSGNFTVELLAYARQPNSHYQYLVRERFMAYRGGTQPSSSVSVQQSRFGLKLQELVDNLRPAEVNELAAKWNNFCQTEDSHQRARHQRARHQSLYLRRPQFRPQQGYYSRGAEPRFHEAARGQTLPRGRAQAMGVSQLDESHSSFNIMALQRSYSTESAAFLGALVDSETESLADGYMSETAGSFRTSGRYLRQRREQGGNSYSGQRRYSSVTGSVSSVVRPFCDQSNRRADVHNIVSDTDKTTASALTIRTEAVAHAGASLEAGAITGISLAPSAGATIGTDKPESVVVQAESGSIELIRFELPDRALNQLLHRGRLLYLTRQAQLAGKTQGVYRLQIRLLASKEHMVLVKPIENLIQCGDHAYTALAQELRRYFASNRAVMKFIFILQAVQENFETRVAIEQRQSVAGKTYDMILNTPTPEQLLRWVLKEFFRTTPGYTAAGSPEALAVAIMIAPHTSGAPSIHALPEVLEQISSQCGHEIIQSVPAEQRETEEML